MPGAALLAFVLLFAAYMLVDGVLAIIAGVRAAQAANARLKELDDPEAKDYRSGMATEFELG